MPKHKKVKDFEKQKLKVGKKKAENANATNTSFQTKTLVMHSQNKGPGLANYLALTRHHQAPARRQALANISDIVHLHEQETGEILRAVAPLMVDEDHQVRMTMLNFLRKLTQPLLAPHTLLLIVHIHAAMTHITPGIRADSTQFLDVLITKCPRELVRQGFTKTLALYFPLMGWPLVGNTQSGSVSTTLSFGKLAPKARSGHLKSLQNLLSFAFKPEESKESVLFHPDTERFLIPFVGNPFDTRVTDDVEARCEVFEEYRAPMLRGLGVVSKEGGETGRLASKIIADIEAV